MSSEVAVVNNSLPIDSRFGSLKTFDSFKVTGIYVFTMPATPEQLSYINARRSQLNVLSKDASDKAVAFLMLTNSGGAIATLSFLGAVPVIRSQWAPKTALLLFIAGIVLVGIFSATWVHHIENLNMFWRRDANRFIDDDLDWQTLLNDDNERAFGRITHFYVMGYMSFACFILGAFIGLVFTSF